MMAIPFSILDLSPIVEGATAADALRNSLALAREAEALGYLRFWLAEHHNMPGIASAATAVVIAHVAGGTSSIRVGSGGVMLPNHAPLVIAEQFGTLVSLYGERIDLGLGRAPGTDPVTARALRRDLVGSADQFPQDVLELQSYFAAPADQVTRAVPGAGLKVPIWLLGSSLYSAQLAALLGLPFAFAAHFAPEYIYAAAHTYRQSFRPSASLKKPHLMIAVQVVAAETDAAARRLFTTSQQRFLRLIRNQPVYLLPPVDSMQPLWQDWEQYAVEDKLGAAIVGSDATVRAGLQKLVTDTGADEVIVVTDTYELADRLQSYERVANIAATITLKSDEAVSVSR